MTLWRRTRNEAAGAWRSLRYDLGRREPGRHAPPPRRGARRGAVHQDVTSSGLHTFGGSLGLRPYPRGGPDVRRTRRLVAVSTLGALAVAGAAGSYFAVIGGVGSLTGTRATGVEPYPLVAQGPPGGEREQSNSGLGRGSAQVPDPAPTGTRPRRVAAPPTRDAAVAVVVPSATTPAPGRTIVESPPPAPVPTDCCPNPPVPTPYEPPPSESPGASPSETPDPSATPSSSRTPDPAAPSATREPGHAPAPIATTSHTR